MYKKIILCVALAVVSGWAEEVNSAAARCPCCGQVLPPGVVVTNLPAPVVASAAQAEVPPAVAAAEPAVSNNPPGGPAGSELQAAAPRDWKASMYGGFSAKSGNTTESSYKYGGEFEKKNGKLYRYKLKLDGRYNQTEDQTTASKADMSGEMRRLLNDRWFVSGRLSGLHDDLKDIAYRVKAGPGFGRYLVDSEKLTADVSTGLLYIRESASDEVSDYIAWRLSQRLDWQLTALFKWWVETELFVNTMEPSHYQVNSKTGVESRLSDRFSLIITVEDDYDSLPERSGQIEKNDFEISTGVRYSL